MDKELKKVQQLCERISMNCIGKQFSMIISRDKRIAFGGGRIYLQIEYDAPCTKTGEISTWRGRKWYLSEFMTNDEIIKTAYAAFEACIKHEIMEGFKVDGIILFNPHVNYHALLDISDNEIKRVEK